MTKEVDNKSIEVINKVLINKLDDKSINKEVNSNTTSWYDIDKFNEILATIDNNNFNHKNKVGKLKFNDINDLINSIKNNTISEADAKSNLYSWAMSEYLPYGDFEWLKKCWCNVNW